ncbi:MAG TPA: FGGY-family carbohydrate kinase [Gaiellales bacterium]
MTRHHWLGLDIGTSSAKALLVGDDGVVVGRGDAAYGTSLTAGGGAEQDPADYLDGARRAIAACGAAGREIAGIGLAGQTPTLVLVGHDGLAVRPALTWQDTRAGAEAAELAAELGASEPLFGTELPWAPAYPPAKLLWLARNEPEALAATRVALQPKDYVGLRLTGSAVSDPWSSKGIAHLDGAPAARALEHVGWPDGIAPAVAPAWSLRGHVGAAAAAAFGVPAGTPVAVGWSDALAGMLATGAFAGETAFVLTGTSSIVGVSTRSATAAGPALLAIPASCAPLRVVYGPTQASGASLAWLGRLLRLDGDELRELAAQPARVGLGDPVFVPYIAGERAPIWRTDVAGAFFGLAALHGPADLARAVVAGVCHSERHVLALAEAAVGRAPELVRVGGRGVSQPPWRDARRATFTRPLLLLDEPDASALGAAMLGAAAAAGGDLAAAERLRSGAERVEGGSGSGGFERYLAASVATLAWTDAAEPLTP